MKRFFASVPRHVWDSGKRLLARLQPFNPSTLQLSNVLTIPRFNVLTCSLIASALAALLLLAGCQPQASIPQGVQVFFSPNGGATEAVVNALDQATNTVLVQAYSFTSAPIARALLDAKRRGVRVQVILDRSQRTEKYSEADFLKNNDVPTLIDAQHAIAHNKIIIIDSSIVLTGSFNFTKAAEEHNAENLLIINDPQLAQHYIQNWHAHEEHSQPYERGAIKRSRERAG